MPTVNSSVEWSAEAGCPAYFVEVTDMSATEARQIVLASRPQRKHRLTGLRLEDTAIPTPNARPGRRPAIVAFGSKFLLDRVLGECQS
jgi:hypothetical protein